MMALSLNKTLCDLDKVPALVESIRLRCSHESKWFLQAEEWGLKAKHSLEQLTVYYEENEKEAYKEPNEFRHLTLLDKHLELLMGSEDLQELFKEKLADLEMVELLLPFIDPSANNNYAIQMAFEKGHVAVVNRLLQDGRVDPSANNNYAIRMASQEGHVAVVDRLLQDGRVDPTTVDASQHVSATTILNRLLASVNASGRLSVDSYDTYDWAFEAIIMAAHCGHVAVVDRLLQDERVDPSASNNAAIRFASCCGHVAVVNRLLQDERVDPSAHQNFAIRFASENGHVAVVDRLLQDERVDPSAHQNLALVSASMKGHVAVVDRLLQDERVDPSAHQNFAIRFASENGHVAVVDRLLHDGTGRVDPSAQDNYAIRYASRNGHLTVVELLKARGCVMP